MSGELRDLIIVLAAVVWAMLVLSGCAETPQQQAYWACMHQHPEPKSSMDKAADVAPSAGSYAVLRFIGGQQDANSPAHQQWVQDERQCEIMAFGHD